MAQTIWPRLLQIGTIVVFTMSCCKQLIAAEPVATRQNVFNIPFSVAPPRTPQEMPREVQLLVSTDRGLNWKTEGGIDPRQGHFTYKAPSDGEYWFQVRTIDHTGRPLPVTEGGPGLKVIVDTAQPTLRVIARRESSGAIICEWESQDPNLDGPTLKLEYQVASGGSWNPMHIDPARMLVQDGASRGQITWWPTVGDPVVVQGSVSDKAGNRAVTQAAISGTRTTSDVAASAATTAPLATNSTSNQSPNQNSLAGQRYRNHPATQSIQPPHMPGQFGGPATGSGSQVATLQESTQKQNVQSELPIITNPPKYYRSPDGSQIWMPTHTADKPLPMNDVSSPVTTPVHSPAQASLYATAEKNNYAPPTTNFPQPQNSSAGFSPTIPTKFVGSTTFEMQYDVGGVPPSQLARVDLWGTSDEGKTWKFFGTDVDRQSPLPITVPQYGVYGFRIVLKGINGERQPQPRPGDLPQIWIHAHDPGNPPAMAGGANGESATGINVRAR